MANEETVRRPEDFPRYEQTFPVLTTDEIERLRRFGETRRYADGESLFRTGDPGPGMFVILSGHVCITQRDGLGVVTPVIEQGPGQFLAEVGQLSGRPALVDGHAEGEVETLLIPPDRLRALLIAEADLGERITRALILRRVNLIQSNAGGPVLVGPAASAAVARLRSFLTRNGQPHHVLDPEADRDAGDIIARYAPAPEDFPLVIVPDGTVLRNPSEVELARGMRMTPSSGGEQVYDVAIVGAGPAGLATAVYGGSEGLSMVIIDCRAFGGQAGASARIENYLGFPTGITGQALAGRAFVQAQKFGVEVMIPTQVSALDCSKSDGTFGILTDAGRVRARSVVVASGAAYRRPGIDRLPEFEGRGVWYWASPIEGKLCAGEEVILVGGGNSAGQAAVFLSTHARKVKMMVRAKGLAASMSKYLIDRIAAAPNIELLTRTEVVALGGEPSTGLETVRWRNRDTGQERTDAIRNLFLFVGADPATDWLQDCSVTLDMAGFVLTGPQDPPETHGAGPLETTVAGVFAVGDVRAGSVKRVGAAIGEGAQVVAALHGYLADPVLPIV